MQVDNVTLDPRELRDVMGSFCTGVTVITGHDGENPIGFACQSLVSVSLEPPLLSFCPARTSTSWPKLRDAQHLCINVLAHDQQELCSAFGSRAGKKFEGVDWTPASNGAPALAGALARIEATVEFEHDAGDHTIVLARITALDVLRHDGPLLFYRGGFGKFNS